MEKTLIQKKFYAYSCEYLCNYPRGESIILMYGRFEDKSGSVVGIINQSGDRDKHIAVLEAKAYIDSKVRKEAKIELDVVGFFDDYGRFLIKSFLRKGEIKLEFDLKFKKLFSETIMLC